MSRRRRIERRRQRCYVQHQGIAWHGTGGRITVIGEVDQQCCNLAVGIVIENRSLPDHRVFERSRDVWGQEGFAGIEIKKPEVLGFENVQPLGQSIAGDQRQADGGQSRAHFVLVVIAW